MRNLLARRPSPALVVSITALIVALGGTSYAAFSLPKNSGGTKQLKNGAVKGKKIANGAVTWSKINTQGLTVPNAINATNATNATNAANAAQLGGAPPSAYLPASKVLRFSFAMNKGDAPHNIGGVGPVTFTATCAADTTKTDAKLAVTTSETGTFVSINPGALPGTVHADQPG